MTDQEHDNPYWRRKKIDRAVDYRRDHWPCDVSPVRVKMTPRQMFEALGWPVPRGPQPIPTYTTYRGYRIEALEPEPPA